MNKEAKKLTSGTSRKVFHKYSSQVKIDSNQDSNTTRDNHNGQVVYDTGPKKLHTVGKSVNKGKTCRSLPG